MSDYPDDFNEYRHYEVYEEQCDHCRGRGYIVICCDDLCRNSDRCIHDDGEAVCKMCNGEGFINVEDSPTPATRQPQTGGDDEV